MGFQKTHTDILTLPPEFWYKRLMEFKPEFLCDYYL